MMPRPAKPRTYTLREASALVFALVSVLPQLLFVYTAFVLDALDRPVAQIGLGSALVLSMIGFYIYSVMMARLAEILLDLETGMAASTRSEAPHGPVEAMAAEPGPKGSLAPNHASGGSRLARGAPSGRPNPFSARSRAGVGGCGGLVVPGMGRITETKPAAASTGSELDSMWKAEAEPLLGRRVLVGVRDAPNPIKGILAQVTGDGVVIDQDGSKSGISYGRVSLIDADTNPHPA